MSHVRLWMIVALSLTGLAGCEKALFPPDTPRSPYERYSVLRGEGHQPPTKQSAAGGDEPALRERLRPLE